MDAEIKAQWVAALRSGDYKQGKDSLRNEGAYCCLGVLCDTINPEGWVEDWYQFGASRSAFVLPGDLRDHLFGDGEDAEVGGTLPFTDRYNDRVTLSSLNDSGWLTFSQLADIIEWAL